MTAAEVMAVPPLSLSQADERADKAARLCQPLLWVCIGSYSLVTLRLAFSLHDSVFGFRTGFDVAIFDQATWLISRGQTPFVTIRGLHILADHFSIILYLLAPLYWLWNSPKTLLAAQTIALALGALPVYALARHRLGTAWLGLLFAVAYLLYPAMQWSNTYEFHPDTFATPLLLAAFLYQARGQWLPYFVALGLAVLTKETVGLTVLALGLYILVGNRQQRRLGLFTVIFGVCSLGIALTTVRHFNNGVPSGYYWLYAKYGDSLSSIAIYALTHPFLVATDLLNGPQREYLFGMLQPLLFLPLIAPEIMLIAAPALLANLLSSREVMHTLLGGYYSASITPFFVVAAIAGYDRLRERTGKFGATALGVNLCIWSLWGTAIGGLWVHYRPHPPQPNAQAQEDQRSDEARRILAIIPPNASVTAQSTLLSHLSHRRTLYTFPNPFHRRAWGNTVQARREMETGADCIVDPAQLNQAITKAPVEYIILCPPTGRFPLSNAVFETCLPILLKNRSYAIIAIGESTILLQHGADHQHGLDLLGQRSRMRVSNVSDEAKALRLWLASQPSSS